MRKIFLFAILAIFSSSIFLNAQETACDKEKGIILGGVGSMGAANLYLAYTTMTLIKANIDQKDNFEYYNSCIDIVDNLLKVVNQSIDDINSQANIPTVDSDFLAQMKIVNISLLDDAVAGRKYLKSASSADLKNFSEKHDKVKIQMEELFKEAK
jgi:hypothetical protein